MFLASSLLTASTPCAHEPTQRAKQIEACSACSPGFGPVGRVGCDGESGVLCADSACSDLGGAQTQQGLTKARENRKEPPNRSNMRRKEPQNSSQVHLALGESANQQRGCTCPASNWNKLASSRHVGAATAPEVRRSSPEMEGTTSMPRRLRLPSSFSARSRGEKRGRPICQTKNKENRDVTQTTNEKKQRIKTGRKPAQSQLVFNSVLDIVAVNF